jgi:hypothetical protein
MISSYRLGDLVLLNLAESEKNDILNEHPNTIGSEYILEKKTNAMFPHSTPKNNIDLLTAIAIKHVHKYANFIPSDISESTVVHLRLGDVVAGTEQHEIGKRPFNINYIKTIINQSHQPTNKRYVIGKCFFAKPSSTNYDECIRLSNAYLQNVITELQAEHFDSGNADIDLCCALKAKLFIQGRGFFSKLIVEIRKRLNLDVIETATHD